MSELLGKRLKALREKKGISQKFVATKIGVNNSTLSGYESGYREPDGETLLRLADFYEVTTDYLLGRSNSSQLSGNTETLINDIDLGLSIDEIMEKYNLKFEGDPLMKDDVEKIITVVKTLMSMRK
ncbi:helix-turn-helix domain-containing protein [Solibacillus isronensis]|uniref:helix-turn-helix domain-containing protein n=1 Tax=Solibacillus isronensis TaxID=412383 RepID=UPI0039A3720C